MASTIYRIILNGCVLSCECNCADQKGNKKKKRVIGGKKKKCLYTEQIHLFSLCVLASPSASDLFHHQPCAGPAGCLSAQLLWQRPGGIWDSKQQVIVWSSHWTPDPAWGPLWENHSRWQYWRDWTPRKWYTDKPLYSGIFFMNMHLNVDGSNGLWLRHALCRRFVCAPWPFQPKNVVARLTLTCCGCWWLCGNVIGFWADLCCVGACVCVCGECTKAGVSSVSIPLISRSSVRHP